jgi:hypothetical protein
MSADADALSISGPGGPRPTSDPTGGGVAPDGRDAALACPSLPDQGPDNSDQVAFRILEPRPLASIRRPSNAFLCPRLGGVVLLERHSPTPHLFDGNAHVGDLKDGLRELPRRPRCGGVDDEQVGAVSDREAHLPIARHEKVRLERLEPHFST